MDEDIITLIDEEGNEEDFTVEMTFEHKGNVYIAFAPADADEDEEVEIRIMRVEENKDPETVEEYGDEYVDIDDEAELDELFQVFLDIMETEE